MRSRLGRVRGVLGGEYGTAVLVGLYGGLVGIDPAGDLHDLHLVQGRSMAGIPASAPPSLVTVMLSSVWLATCPTLSPGDEGPPRR